MLEVRRNFVKRHAYPLIILAVLTAALLLGACGDEDIAALPEAQPADVTQLTGIQTNVPVATLLSLRWKPCYADTYDTSGVPLATILDGCPGAHLMLACRPVGNSTLTLLSHAPRSVVTAVTSTQATTFTDHNGVGWYYNDSYSWGFFVSGDGLNKSSCDIASGLFPGSRLCWHASGGAIQGGYRCGSTAGLNGNPSWERLLFTSG